MSLWWSSVAALALSCPLSAQVAACYDAEVGPWTPVPGEINQELPPPDTTADSLLYAFPPRIEIEENGTLRVPEGALRTAHDRLSWRSPREDSLIVHLGWKAYAGVNTQLLIDDEGWWGESRTWAHTPGQRRYSQPIRLRRVDCASVPPVRADEDRWVPLELELRSGMKILVGGRSHLEDGRHELDLIELGARGDYAGASLAQLWVESGRVVRARMHFEEAALSSAVARIFDSEDRSEIGLMRSNRSGTVLYSEGAPWIAILAQPGRLTGGSLEPSEVQPGVAKRNRQPTTNR